MTNRSNFYKLEMLLMNILKEEDCYGYQITKSIRDYSNNKIKIGNGTMYNILYKLLDEGYITSYEKVIGRKIRIYYHLEPSGKEYMEQLIQEFNDMVLTVQNIIQHKKVSSTYE